MHTAVVWVGLSMLWWVMGLDTSTCHLGLFTCQKSVPRFAPVRCMVLGGRGCAAAVVYPAGDGHPPLAGFIGQGSLYKQGKAAAWQAMYGAESHVGTAAPSGTSPRWQGRKLLQFTPFRGAVAPKDIYSKAGCCRYSAASASCM